MVDKQPNFSSSHFRLRELKISETRIQEKDIFSRFHEDVASGDLTAVQNICVHYPEYLNKTTANQEDSALHIAARNGHLPIFGFLLSQETLNITRNMRGDNALDVAIAAKQNKIALHISSHPRWREFLHEKEAETELTQLQHMIIKMPVVAERFLDRFFKQSGDPESEDTFKIEYDFSFLYDMPRRVESGSIRKPSNNLKTMVDQECIACLTHPVCLAYMKDKWKRIGFWMLHFNLLFYLIFLSCLTTLTILLEHRSPDIAIYIRATRYVVLSLCFVQLGKEMIQMIHLKFHYFEEVENWIEIALYTISASCMIIYGSNEDKKRTNAPLRGTIALSIFLAWTVLILHIRRSVMLGSYIIMMVTIVTTLLKIVLLMLPFVCAYGIPFYILFSIPEYPPCEKDGNEIQENCSNTTEESKHLFDSMPMSLWTTFMLLLGEMKYPHTLYKYQPLPYPYVTYLVYVTFVLCMPIIIKNLMIGLSVGDVKRIKDSARQKYFISQVNTIIGAEETLPSFVLSWLYISHVTEYPLRKISLVRKLLDIGFDDIITHSSSQEEKTSSEMKRKSDLDEIENTVINLRTTMNNQEKKINEIFDILQEIKNKVLQSDGA